MSEQFNPNPGIKDCLPKRQILVTPEKLQQFEELREEKARIEEAKKRNCKKKWKWGFTFCPCPMCGPSNRVQEQVSGKEYFRIPFTSIKLPRLDLMIDPTKSHDANRRPGETCKACDGTKKLPNPARDDEKHEKVAEKLKEKAAQILDRESKLGTGGHRTTVVQGCETLIVGGGAFNSNVTHKVAEDQGVTATMSGGYIPQMSGKKTNAVKGIQHQVGWPQSIGNYSIKCANKFDLLAGAGGIELTTKGPLTINAAQVNFSGAELGLGSKEGQMAIEGKSVNITGESISITPTGGELFVKGTINNTGNTNTQGHGHYESISFTKASAIATNKSTKHNSASVTNNITHKAVYGGMGLAQAGMDVSLWTQSLLTDFTSSAFRALSPAELSNLSARISNMAYQAGFIEPIPHGWIMPGTHIGTTGVIVLGGTTTVTSDTLVPVFLEPHCHMMPNMQHNHEMVVPDIDINAQTPAQLRMKVMNGAQESGVPNHPTGDILARIQNAIKTTAESAASIGAAMGLTTSKASAGLA